MPDALREQEIIINRAMEAAKHRYLFYFLVRAVLPVKHKHSINFTANI